MPLPPARPTPEIVDALVPPYDIDGLPISDGYYVRDVTRAEYQEPLRLARKGASTTLVAFRAYYDGGNGGVPGHYANLFAEVRLGKTAWRIGGVRVLAEEAGRLARDMEKGMLSKPARHEEPRAGGKEVVSGESQLRGAPSGRGYVIYVRSRSRSGGWARTRGAEVLKEEIPAVVKFLKQLAEVK